jgi:carboxyl-terminal processing protease
VISDGSLLYLAVRNVAIDREILEGKGVEPDIVVPTDIRYSQGKDPQLEQALLSVLKK